MIRYKFSSYVDDLGITHVEKMVDKEYHYTTDDYKTLLKTSKDTERVKMVLKEIKIGIKDEPIIKLENEWYEIVSELTKLKLELNSIKDSGTPEDIARIEQLTGYTVVDYSGPMGSKVEKYHPGLINDLEDKLMELEDKNKWLKPYRGLPEEKDRNGEPILRPSIELVVLNDNEVKDIIRHARDNEVRDIEDSVADIAKSTSLAFTVIGVLWNLIDEDKKLDLPEETVKLIDYAVEKFNNIETRADKQLLVEGTKLIDKIYDREVKIADIVEKHKNNIY